MDKFCIIGNPLNHSLSPKIFHYIFNKLNIDAIYTKVALTENNFNDFIKEQRKNNIYKGINVTIPYKERVYKALDEIDNSCNDIQSINCIKNINNRLIGYNTDQYGLLMLIKKNQLVLESKNIIILGNGGIARTTIKTLLDNFTNNIYVWGRNSTKVKNLINSFDEQLYRGRILKLEDISNKKYTIINCISLNIDETSVNNILSYIPITNIELMIDLNYIETVFNKQLIKNGCNVIFGIDMLLYQALQALDIWYEKNYSQNIIFKELKKHIMHI